MGCSISCSYFEAFSSFLEWVVKEKAGGRASITHYLDDFLCVGAAKSRECELILACMLEVFRAFGVPVAHDKTEGPATSIKFLGIEIDTVEGVCRLPADKVRDLETGLEGILGLRKIRLKQLQSVLGITFEIEEIILVTWAFFQKVVLIVPLQFVQHLFLQKLMTTLTVTITVKTHFSGYWGQEDMNIRSIFVLFLLFLTILFFYQLFYINHGHHAASSDDSQKPPVHLLIVSSWRSGSSFLGQIFNHHPDVFYLFEPGHCIWMKFRNESAEFLHYLVRDLFRSLFTCDVSSLQQYLPRGGKKISDMGFYAESRALCSPPSCQGYVPSEGFDRYKCLHRCKNTPLEKMAETCKRYSHVVMKTVRILDLSVLLPLFRDLDLDLRILHLIRDPRAVASSRKSFSLSIEDRIVLEGSSQNTKLTTNEIMAKICNAQVNINKLAMAARQTLGGRYMLVRHEDLAQKPLEKAKEMFEFADLKMTEDLERWIYNITHLEAKGKWGFMSYSKQSSNVVQGWRKTMDFKMVKEIEQVCRDSMNLFGYLPVKSVKQQKNMSVELFT
ncbi:carbohydrate sulfotransferase 4-like [Gastrophryne carolinensis]